ncbi:CEP19-like protein-domain-containing protein [Zopfochytrium polystomum]|nr:CEP19-like protein-domain-containing protein [Zopfochytrium polystomum]
MRERTGILTGKRPPAAEPDDGQIGPRLALTPPPPPPPPPEGLRPIKIAARLAKPTLYVDYHDTIQGKLRRRTIPVRSLAAAAAADSSTSARPDARDILADLVRKHPVLRCVAEAQLLRVINRLAAQVCGARSRETIDSTPNSLLGLPPLPTKTAPLASVQGNLRSTPDAYKVTKADVTIDGRRDLNKLETPELEAVKTLMNKDFEKNLVRPGDPGYQYDLQKSFKVTNEPNDWDAESDPSEKPPQANATLPDAKKSNIGEVESDDEEIEEDFEFENEESHAENEQPSAEHNKPPLQAAAHKPSDALEVSDSDVSREPSACQTSEEERDLLADLDSLGDLRHQSSPIQERRHRRVSVSSMAQTLLYSQSSDSMDDLDAPRRMEATPTRFGLGRPKASDQAQPPRAVYRMTSESSESMGRTDSVDSSAFDLHGLTTAASAPSLLVTSHAQSLSAFKTKLASVPRLTSIRDGGMQDDPDSAESLISQTDSPLGPSQAEAVDRSSPLLGDRAGNTATTVASLADHATSQTQHTQALSGGSAPRDLTASTRPSARNETPGAAKLEQPAPKAPHADNADIEDIVEEVLPEEALSDGSGESDLDALDFFDRPARSNNLKPGAGGGDISIGAVPLVEKKPLVQPEPLSAPLVGPGKPVIGALASLGGLPPLGGARGGGLPGLGSLPPLGGGAVRGVLQPMGTSVQPASQAGTLGQSVSTESPIASASASAATPTALNKPAPPQARAAHTVPGIDDLDVDDDLDSDEFDLEKEDDLPIFADGDGAGAAAAGRSPLFTSTSVAAKLGLASPSLVSQAPQQADERGKPGAESRNELATLPTEPPPPAEEDAYGYSDEDFGEGETASEASQLASGRGAASVAAAAAPRGLHIPSAVPSDHSRHEQDVIEEEIVFSDDGLSLDIEGDDGDVQPDEDDAF